MLWPCASRRRRTAEREEKTAVQYVDFCSRAIVYLSKVFDVCHVKQIGIIYLEENSN